jgi:hypothetical protein
MMRNIAIALAAATIAMGGSTLSASALHGQQSGISKGSVSGSLKTHRFGPRSYGFYQEERGLTPREREHARRVWRKAYAETTPREREYFRGVMRERLAGLTPREGEHLGRIMRERLAGLTPREREYLRAALHERLAELTPREREHLGRVVRERMAELTPRERAYFRGIIRERMAVNPSERADITSIERELFYRHGPYGRH